MHILLKLPFYSGMAATGAPPEKILVELSDGSSRYIGYCHVRANLFHKVDEGSMYDVPGDKDSSRLRTCYACREKDAEIKRAQRRKAKTKTASSPAPAVLTRHRCFFQLSTLHFRHYNIKAKIVLTDIT